MVNNVQGSDNVVNRQVQQNSINALLNQKRLQGKNPYADFPIQDKADISQEAKALLTKEQELEHFKKLAKNEPDFEPSKVELLKAQFEAGLYKMPSDEDLASALLGDEDFKAMMGF